MCNLFFHILHYYCQKLLIFVEDELVPGRPQNVSNNNKTSTDKNFRTFHVKEIGYPSLQANVWSLDLDPSKYRFSDLSSKCAVIEEVVNGLNFRMAEGV